MNLMSNWFKKNRNIVIGISSTFFVLVVLAIFMDCLVMPLYVKHGKEL